MHNNNLIYNRANNLLLILVFCFPFIIVIGSAAINIATVLISIITIHTIFKKEKKFFFENKLLILFFCFFLFIVLNAVFHYQSFGLLMKSIGNFRYLLLTIGVLFVLEKANKKQITYFININLILIILICFDIIYQFLFYKNIFGFIPGMCSPDLSNCTRFSGVFEDELIAGAYIGQIGLLVFFLKMNLNFEKSNYLILGLFLLFFSTIIITGERNAFLIFILTVFFIFIFLKKIKYIFYMSILLLSIFAVFIQIDLSVKKRFFNFNSFTNSYLSVNNNFMHIIKNNPWVYHYEAATELFLEKPILGHGLKSFRVKCAKTSIEKKLLENRIYYKDYRACSTHPHNYLLELLSEQGIFGGLFYISIILLVLFNIYKIIKKNNRKNRYILCTCIGSLILAIVFPLKPSGSFLTTFNAAILFYIFGFFIFYQKEIK